MGNGISSDNKTLILNGTWKLAIDPDNKGIAEEWFAREGAVPEEAMWKDAPVPGTIQQVYPDAHGVVWYTTEFAPGFRQTGNNCYLLQFGAVDYWSKVWLNGTFIGEHEGGEDPFAFDVGDSLLWEGSNRLTVRVLNASTERIDGVTISEIPHRNKIGSNTEFYPGASYNHGGIMQSVTLAEVADVRIDDIFVKAFLKTGSVEVEVSLRNDSGKPFDGKLVLLVRPARNGQTLLAEEFAVHLPTGASDQQLTLQINQPQAWNVNDPFLYRLQVQLHAKDEQKPLRSEQTVSFGFRTFEVKDGFFHLNGKRIYLRSTHTGNHYPVGMQFPHDRDYLLKDLIYAKASGFNMIRFIAGVAYPEQLDYCDEIGLMVYEECYAAWCLEDSPAMGERFDNDTLGMIRRDRNHPSVVIWGLLNETFDGPVFRHAHGFLPKLRKADDTRLVVLASGRWDIQQSVGSVSNPFSREWEPVWGNESSGELAEARKEHWYASVPGYFKDAGDAHLYPHKPESLEAQRIVRTLGEGIKPVYLSEYGYGSLLDVIHGTRMYEQIGASDQLLDAALFRSMMDRFLADWEKFGMEGIYPFPDDFFRESQRLQSDQRRGGFDLVRSNPQICGYNITGILDHGMTGEGLWTFFREWKPDIVETLTDGWSAVRWCLFVANRHGYSGDVFKVEAVLANEDVLPPGDYRVQLRICSDETKIWEKTVDFVIPEAGENGYVPFAIPVFSEDVILSGPSGTYRMAARLEEKGAPAGDRKHFFMTDAAELPELSGSVVLWGIEENVKEWLEAMGSRTSDFEAELVLAGDEIILVGNLTDEQVSGRWDNLLSHISGGGQAIFLSPAIFAKDKERTERIPLENKGTCEKLHDGLYHKECVAKAHPVFAGLGRKGILDWNYYGGVIPHYIFAGQEASEDVAAVAFTTGYVTIGGYKSGMLYAGYPLGEGTFYLNSFRILENVAKHPAADRLLVNMINYAGKR